MANMPTLSMHPGTTARASVTVTAKEPSTGVVTPVTDATVVGVFWDFDGKLVANNQAFTNAGDGKYTLDLQAAWTEDEDGLPQEGMYVLDVVITKDANQLTERVQVRAKF